MKKLYKKWMIIALIAGLFSCSDDLDTIPLDPTQTTSATVYDSPEAYKQVLAKVYAGFAVSGQEGPAGRPDISGIDEGFGQYLRGYWYHQELPTDEAIIGWNDQTIMDFNDQSWTSVDGFTFAFYNRIFYQIALCNEFLRETTNQKLNERGESEELKTEIAMFRAEARFLRALSYWHALDLFRNVPFVTEEDAVGAFQPNQIQGEDLFEFIESELLEIEDELAAPRSNEFGRVDQAAAWTLLVKVSVNTEIYTGNARYNEAFDFCEKVINSGYQLDEEYQNLFLTDNDQSNEIIFRVAFDGLNTRTWGGMTFIISAAIGGSMDPADLGMAGGWSGTRAIKNFVQKFPEGNGGILVERNPGATASYRKLYVPGTHQGNDPTDTKNSISDPGNNGIYEGHKFFPEPNTEIRFTQIPSSSAPIYGDNNGDGELDFNGDPILVPEAGLYFIEVDWTNKTYTIESRNYRIEGSALPDGPITDLEYNAERRALVGSSNMVPGGFQLVDENGVVIYGDDDGDGILIAGEGEAQVIDSEGEFDIALFLDQPDYAYEITTDAFDRRGMFYREGQSLEIEDVTQFTDGLAVNKFKNVSSTGVRGSDATFPDTDFPMFRLADVLLMAAEASLRGGGSTSQGLEYLNRVRRRAYGGSSTGNVSEGEFTLDLILDERARELYWECHRRTDLIRFGQFTDGDYLWQWKGGVREGKTVEQFRRIFPIPASDLNSNPKLEQNEGY